MSNESQAKKVLTIFDQRSFQAHNILKKEILHQKMGIAKIDQAIEKYLQTWNNNLRQGLLSIAFELVGGNPEDIIPLQIALSFIDATMDIHDDIIDDSVKKKNCKTLYGRLEKGTALLIGDKFMVNGFLHLYKAIEHLPKDKQSIIMETVNDFLEEVAKAHIAESQLKTKKWSVKPNTYLNILIKKAAEIEGRMKIVAIFGSATDDKIQALGKFGRDLGILLAIRAEYTDLFEPSELSNRVKSECLPLHVLYVLQSRGSKEEIMSILSKPNLTRRDSYDLLQTISGNITLAPLNRRLKSLHVEAGKIITIFPNGHAKTQLQLIIDSMLEDL
jgi:geranylgeranyl pyrophosphate synthase